MKSVDVSKTVVTAAVLEPVDGLGVAAGVDLRVAQVRVQLVDDRRAHVNEVRLADVEATLVNVKHVKYLHRRQALQRNTEIVSTVSQQESSVKLTNQRVSYAFTSSPINFHACHILPASKFQYSYSCILLIFYRHQ